MSKVLGILLLLMVVGAAIAPTAQPAAAQELIRSYGAGSFVYDNHAYVPVRSTSNYIGAGFTWDPYANSATVVYRNRNLTLVVGTTSAYYNNEPVVLAAPVVVVRDQLYCPATAFNRYLDVPMRWEPRQHRALFQGPPGWGYYDVDPRTPPYALGVFVGYGYVPAYQPTPFMYGGAAYLPLRSVADVIGAVLLFDLFNDRCVVTYSGVQTVLFIGSPRCYYGDRVVVLRGAPIVYNNVVYVPQGLVADQWRVPVQREGGGFRVQGDRGRYDFTVAPAPPARIYRSMAAAPLLRTAASGLRSVGMTRPMDPGLVSRARRGTAAAPGGRARGGPGTGFPALAATRPHGGTAAAPRGGGGKAKAGTAAAPRGGGGKAKAGAAAAPRSGGKTKGGAVAAQRSGGKTKGGAVAAPRGGGKTKGGAVATPRAGGGKAKAGAAAAPRSGGRPQGGAAAAPRSGGRPQGGAAAAPRGGGKAQGGTAAAPRGGGKAQGGAAAAPRGGGKAQGGAAAAPRGGGKAQGGAAAAPRGGGKGGAPQGKGGQTKKGGGQGRSGG